MSASPPLVKVLNRLSAIGSLVTTKKDGSAMAQCPCHMDKKQSLAVSTNAKGDVIMFDHAGCETPTIVTKIGMTMAELFVDHVEPPVIGSGPKGTIVEVYPYTDDKGTLQYEAVRLDPKDFRQRRPDGKGGYLWNMQGATYYLYKLADLLKKNRDTVFLVEGEKDADTLWSHRLPATTNVGGAGKWRSEYTEQLVAAKVKQAVIFPDNDEPGRKHAEKVAAALHAAGITVKVVYLPVIEKGDVSDYLAEHSKEELFALVKAAAVWAPSAAEPQAITTSPTVKEDPAAPAEPSSKATIITNTHTDWHDLLETVFSELVAVNASSQPLFQRGLRLVRVRVDEESRPLIEPMTEASLKGLLAEAMLWLRKEQRALVPVQPPDAVIKHLLSRKEWGGIPALRDIIQSPVFTKDGLIITATGYHAASRLWYAPTSGLQITVPAMPTVEDIRQARALLLEELLGEFPFDSDAS